MRFVPIAERKWLLVRCRRLLQQMLQSCLGSEKQTLGQQLAESH